MPRCARVSRLCADTSLGSGTDTAGGTNHTLALPNIAPLLSGRHGDTCKQFLPEFSDLLLSARLGERNGLFRSAGRNFERDRKLTYTATVAQSGISAFVPMVRRSKILCHVGSKLLMCALRLARVSFNP